MSSLLNSVLPQGNYRRLQFLGVTVAAGVTLHVLLRLKALLQKKYREDSLLKDFPSPPKHWLLGHLGLIKTSEQMLPVLMDWTFKYGGARKACIGPFLNEVILSEPDGLKAILTAEPKESNLYKFFKPWIGDGLLISNGKKWARNRRLLTPAFHFEILKPYVSVFSTSANVMIQKWGDLLQKGPEIEMFHHISLMTLDSLLKCAFNYDRPVQIEGRNNPYIESVYLLSELLVKRFRNIFHHIDFIFYLTADGRRFRKACQFVQGYSRDVITARREQKISGNVHEKKYLDFLDILLEARDEAGEGLTDTEIQHEVDTFMLAGHDTTASAISWFMYNMAAHPEHQEKCYQEVTRVLGSREEVTWEDLPHLEYLTYCIKESLRMHSTIIAVSRHTTKPVSLQNGLTIPEDMWVTAGLYMVHHNPEVWEDPETYNPLRFTPENSEGRPPHAFVPFSAGPRNCIGQNFAMYEMKTVGALLLKHFEFSVAKEPIKYPEVVLRTKDGLWLNVRERNPADR